MRNQTHTPSSEKQNPLFTVVGTRRRRSILTILLDRTTAVSEQGLAFTLAALEQECSVAEVPSKDVRRIRCDLRHTHLPLLADNGLVTWKRDEETVTTTNHIALTDQRFHRLLAVERTKPDGILTILSNKRRRRLLAILRDDPAPISQTALARAIAQRETDETAPSPAVIDEIAVTLAHSHLPTLSDAGLIAYDAETGYVAYAEHPALEDLLTILNKPDNPLVTKLDGFFGDLLTSYRQAGKSSEALVNWPNFWSESQHG